MGRFARYVRTGRREATERVQKRKAFLFLSFSFFSDKRKEHYKKSYFMILRGRTMFALTMRIGGELSNAKCCLAPPFPKGGRGIDNSSYASKTGTKKRKPRHPVTFAFWGDILSRSNAPAKYRIFCHISCFFVVLSCYRT